MLDGRDDLVVMMLGVVKEVVGDAVEGCGYSCC